MDNERLAALVKEGDAQAVLELWIGIPILGGEAQLAGGGGEGLCAGEGV